MSRRADPARIDKARHDATRNRLIGERVTPATADAWIAAWDAHAAREGLEPGREYWGTAAGGGSPRRGSAASGHRNGPAAVVASGAGCPR
jgi:hypothetical protein